MILTYSGVALILIFLFVTYIMSAYEKLGSWKNTVALYCDMYRGVFSTAIVKISIRVILGLELITCILISIALYNIITVQSLWYAQYACMLSGFLIIILLFGLRILKDYAGSSGLGIYFLISILGLFWSQFI
jgi:putative oxidoreductase